MYASTVASSVFCWALTTMMAQRAGSARPCPLRFHLVVYVPLLRKLNLPKVAPLATVDNMMFYSTWREQEHLLK